MTPFETNQNENDNVQYKENHGFLSSDDDVSERSGTKMAKLTSKFGLPRKNPISQSIASSNIPV